VPGEKLQKLRRLACTSSRPRGERNPLTWRARRRSIERGRSITLKSEPGSLSSARINVCVRRCEPSAPTPHMVASPVHRRCIAGASRRGAGPACVRSVAAPHRAAPHQAVCTGWAWWCTECGYRTALSLINLRLN